MLRFLFVTLLFCLAFGGHLSFQQAQINVRFVPLAFSGPTPVVPDCSCQGAAGPVCCTNGIGPGTWCAEQAIANGGPDGCQSAWVQSTCNNIEYQHVELLRPHLSEEMSQLERYMTQDLMAGYLLPGLMAMTEQLTVVAMHQVLAIGTFFDAQMEASTQRTLQEIQATAHKEYQPSESVCTFATTVRSLALSDRYVDLTQSILSSRALSRHLARENDAGQSLRHDFGYVEEDLSNNIFRGGRREQFENEYCDPTDINSFMSFLCGNGNAGGADEPGRLDNDIDYANVFEAPETLDMNFLEDLTGATPPTTSNISANESDVFALAKNLYGHRVLPRLTKSELSLSSDYINGIDQTTPPGAQAYANFRSLQAKRSVVENSFNSIMAMKAQGANGSSDYLSAILSELGMSGQQISALLAGAPSYHAQMEVLTKKVFQNPQFFINLYDTPVNVNRQYTAVKGIGLMQQWDMFETQLRTEMLSALLVEISLIEKQEEITGRTN